MQYLTVFLSACLFFFTTFCKANTSSEGDSPSSFFVKVDGGYNLPGSSQLLGFELTLDGARGVYGSMGEGGEFNLSGGYSFHDNISVTLGAGYLHSSERNAIPFVGSDYTIAAVLSGLMFASSGKINASAYLIKPGLRLNFPMNDVIEFYSGAGMLIGMPQMNVEINSRGPGGFAFEELNAEIAFKRSTEVGVFAESGINVALGHGVDFAAGIYLGNLNYSPTSGEIVKLEIDGEDLLDEVDHNPFDIEERVSGFNFNPDDERENQLLLPVGFSALSLRLGLQYSF